MLAKMLRAAFGSLGRHKLRSALSVLGVVLGVAAMIATLAVAEGARHEIVAQINQLGTSNLILKPANTDEPEGSARISDEQLQLLSALPGVRAVGRLAELPAEVPEAPDGAGVVATDRPWFTTRGIEPAEGRLLTDMDEVDRSQVCVLGAILASQLGRAGRIGSLLRIEDSVWEVVGVLEPRAAVSSRRSTITVRDVDRTVFLPLSAQASLGSEWTVAPPTEVTVRVDRPEDTAVCAELVKRTLAVSDRGPQDYRLVIPRELMARALGAQRVFNLVLAAVALISLLVGGTGIMNIMLASVSERTHEIGVRRAVGASRAHLLLHFLFEALALTLVGGVLGVLTGFLGAWTIASLGQWTTAVNGSSILLALGMAVIVGLASGLYPAMQAARLDPIVALRNS